jgi:hypothetical protein
MQSLLVLMPNNALGLVNLRYAVGVLIPAALLLCIGASLAVVSSNLGHERPDLDAKGEALVKKMETDPLPPDVTRSVVRSAIDSERQSRKVSDSATSLLNEMAWPTIFLSLWIVIGGYLAATRPNKALQRDAAASPPRG